MENQKDKEYLQKDKEAFFAMYHGQFIGVMLNRPDYLHLVGMNELFTSHILLKSLENISNEDAKKCGYNSTKLFYEAFMWSDPLDQHNLDYLRSQSYLIGFRHYSIEEILKLGWAVYV